MKIAIHKSNTGFHPYWEQYCKEKGIDYKIVDCYSNDIISQLTDCKALLWHHGHTTSKDILIATKILFALEHTGFKVFPNFKTAWHFDDKIAQKYLFERIDAKMVPSYVFFDKEKALQWINTTTFPKVFKLRGGAGSSNVMLVRTKKEAVSVVNTAFRKGFSNYNAWGNIKERWRKYKLGKVSIKEPIKGLIRLVKPPLFTKVLGKEIGYAYFQDFIPDNTFDIRIIVIDGKAFALKRFTRNNDFRASGSGNFSYAKEEFDEQTLRISFNLADKLDFQCAAFDFVYNENNEPLVVEVSYGFVKEGYDLCPGYWDKNLNWHETQFNPQGWIIDALIRD